MNAKRKPPGLKNEANADVPKKLQFLKLPLEAGSKSKSVLVDPRGDVKASTSQET